MIGQQFNKVMIETWRRSDSFPRFIIITGARGSGKKTLADFINREMMAMKIYVENGVDSVRDAIEQSYKTSIPTTYIFSDTDKMSVQAKNALLKVTEEPPRKATFIMTVEDINNTLGTLKSRGTVLYMEPYTVQDLLNFNSDERLCNIATNPGEVKELEKLDISEFIAYCEKVLDNIATVTGGNAFKISNAFKFKEDQESGYDPILFLNCVIFIYAHRIIKSPALNQDEQNKYVRAMWACSRCKQQLKMTGVKKDSTFDMWILEMREILRGE